MKSRTFAWGVCAVLSQHARVGAAEPVAGLNLEYRAAAGCPTKSEFRSWVDKRSRRAVSAEGRLFQVVLSEGPPAARGRLTVHEPTGATSEREVEGRDCRDAAQALALIVAFALDGAGEKGGEPSTTDSSSASPASRTAASRDGARPVGEQAGASSVSPSAHWRWTAHLGAGASVFEGMAPGVLLAPQLSAGIGYRGRHWLSVSVFGRGWWSEERSFPAAAGSASFSYAGAGVDVCAGAHPTSTDAVAVHLCGAGEWGGLSAAGAGTDEVESRRISFVAGGAALLVDVALYGPLRGGVRGALLAPTRVDQFLLNGELVHETAAPVLRAGVDLRVDFEL